MLQSYFIVFGERHRTGAPGLSSNLIRRLPRRRLLRLVMLLLFPNCPSGLRSGLLESGAELLPSSLLFIFVESILLGLILAEFRRNLEAILVSAKRVYTAC